MKLNQLFPLSLISAAICVSPNVVADEDFFNMSIEELLNVETDVAGFRSESLANSPSIVTVFTANQLQALAVNNLYDLMNYVPGFQTVLGEWLSGHKKLQSRGVYLDTGYVLVMKDGVRLNEISFGKASVYTPYIDVSGAEKVEIIRGPGSSVYGSNAFLGVINIISKKTNDLSIELGSNGHTRLTTNMVKEVGEGELAFNLAMVAGDGERFELANANQDQDLSIRRPYQHTEFSLLYQYGNLNLGYYFDQHELDKFVNLNGYHPQNQFESKNQYLKAGYDHEISRALSLNFEVQYADHDVESAGLIFAGDVAPLTYDFLTGPNWGTDRFTVNLNATYQYNEQWDLVFGGQYQKERQDLAGVVSTHITPDGANVIPIDDYYLGRLEPGYSDPDGPVWIQTFDKLGEFEQFLQSVESSAVFAEAKYQHDDKQTIHFGGRFEDYKSAGSAFSPRISYINKFAEGQQIKAIYSEAFRAPVTNELYSDDGVTLGNPDLKPELVKTMELQYLINREALAFEATWFNTRLSELIASEPIDDTGRTTFVNKGSDRVSGFEMLAHYTFSEQISGRATYTHYLTDTIEGAYDNFASFNVFFDFDNINASLNAVYRPSVSISEGIRLGNQNMEVFSENSLLLLGGQLSYQLGRNLKLRLAVENLTDESYAVYEPRQNINEYRISQLGRNVRLSASYQF